MSLKIWTDREGKKLTASEFVERFKQGVEKVTPLQSVKSNLLGYTIVVIGILWGLVISFTSKQYWLLTILLGSSFITGTAIIGVLKTYFILTKLEQEVNYGEEIGEESKGSE